MALRSDRGAAGQLHLAFNQDCSCLAIADWSGIRVWNLNSHTVVLDLPLGAISIAKMLFATSLLAFVGAGEQPHLTPRKLTLLNSHSNSVIQSLSFPASVLGVYLNRKRLVAVLERRAFVYDLESLALCGTLDTPHNPLGLAALTSCHMPSCLLALPAEGGMVRVYDVARGGGAAGGPAGSGVDVLCELEAHKAPVTVMAWDDEGQLLATASKKGTVIRVHPVRHEGKALEFRRGSTPATVTCLAFSPPSLPARLLAAASDHGTIHIFRLEAPGRHPEAAAAKSLLSAVMAGVLEPQRPLATVRLPGKGQAAICAVTHEEAEDGGEGAAAEWETRLAVATAEGILYSYRLEVPGGAGTAGGDSSGGGGSSLRASLEGEWSLLTGRTQPSPRTEYRTRLGGSSRGKMARALGKALRETGQALDRLGRTLQGNFAFREELNRHRSLAPLLGKVPSLGRDAFVAPSAAVIGDVRLGSQSSVFYGSVVRADCGSITIGDKSNVQDGCVIRTAPAYLAGRSADTVIGREVTIGHQASLHGCTVGDRALVGMGATLLEGSEVEPGAMVAAGAVVAPGTVVRSGEIWGGNPAVFLRKLKPEEAAFLGESAEHYARLAAEHAQEAGKPLEQVAAEKGLAA